MNLMNELRARMLLRGSILMGFALSMVSLALSFHWLFLGRALYGTAPLLVQLAIIHCGSHFTAGERNALMNTAQAHGEIQSLMCEAFKAEQKVP